ncbi:CAP domain-containing protein [Flavobacterium ardleyense]|uniref:CAP domain-containing protein n=1 Tax=Flavobacterium ardleyense TaxID=2038737 RepID=A0ABW5Z521_9FLAO
MKKIIITIVALTFISLTSCSSDSDNVSNSNPIETAKSYTHAVNELELLDEVNSYRVSVGLIPLQIIEHISHVSSQHNDYMIAVKNANHDGFSERKSNLKQVLCAVRVGENVAYGFNTSKATVSAWTTSPSHKANLEGDYSHFGASIKTDDAGRKYYTNMFIKK